jgi:hypothetical protein
MDDDAKGAPRWRQSSEFRLYEAERLAVLAVNGRLQLNSVAAHLAETEYCA